MAPRSHGSRRGLLSGGPPGLGEFVPASEGKAAEVARTCVVGPRFVPASEAKAADLEKQVCATPLCAVLEKLYRGRMGWGVVKMWTLLRALEGPDPAVEPDEAPRRECLSLKWRRLYAAIWRGKLAATDSN